MDAPPRPEIRDPIDIANRLLALELQDAELRTGLLNNAAERGTLVAALGRVLLVYEARMNQR